ncbi:Triacylglycerol lipase SDP1 [Gracilariopsis chorda]|uniref:Triacylglycerol lipase SDP1 n=1 Tax=Gracilariopsis chorda TaxID=448386 RepID=A0A2V3IZH4_9FLOR|nr:Triacylglycerol lipase SDP1 [Gracilariopsis chorda]|eukprot:PXF47544.1 Triacylglycerol lipase SDP1 [Gracilariopsis chorda]
MRRYAPHNTTFQTWSAPNLTPSSRQRALTHLSSLRDAFLKLFAPPPPLPPRPQNHAHSPTDDVHAEPRLAALHRWLDLRPPLSDPARSALRKLMRPEAVIVRSDPKRAQCRVCNDLFTPEPSSNGLDATRSAWILNGDFWQFVTMFIFGLLYVLLSILQWVCGIRGKWTRRIAFRRQRHYLTSRLQTAPNYSAWHCAADELDMLEGRSEWKRNSSDIMEDLCTVCDQVWNTRAKTRERAAINAKAVSSVGAVCDIKMIAAKLRELSVLFNNGDVHGLAYALRASLLRNLGGMCHPEMHAHSLVGTNLIVEDYVNVVSFLIAYIAESEPLKRTTPIQSASVSPVIPHSSREPAKPLEKITIGLGARTFASQATKDIPQHSDQVNVSKQKLLSNEDKLTFLNEARHAYGRTALMLSGGAAMGMYHLGVVKALLDQRLLPKVVCGTSAGALIASIVGIFQDEELDEMLKSEDLINPLTGDTFVFRYFDEHLTFARRLRRFISKGFIQDVKMLQDCLRKTFGDLTFEEAYTKTRRILNITVCPSRSSSDPPVLLNYLTAPHVLIWSAASASCALPLIFAPVELVAKSASGRMVPYHPDGVRWIDGSISSDVPLARIGELFNVNHFIVSQTNPHVIPRSMPIMHTRAALLLKSELQFRYWQAMQMGLIPKLLSSIFPHFMQPYAGDVTIMPEVRLSDLGRLLSNPTRDAVLDYIRRGEIHAFPYLDRIRLHCLIERTLDQSVEYVATMARSDEETAHETTTSRRYGLFGRVPSWLWFDTRSLLPSGGMSAVASRLGARKKEDDESSAASTSEKNRCI